MERRPPRPIPGKRLKPLIPNTEREAQRVALAWLRAQRPGVQVEELRLQPFAEGWLASLPVPEGVLTIGSLRLIVDKHDLSVHSFPSNRSVEWTIREYVARRGERP